ncbi:MAG TPA: LysM peptidoglycan-binding domain-containing protein [Tissierellaceae bacterium]|nr:LysM peptidoglycan-binding domain-containing protein [Tissierellaceae bacterium]
MRKYRIVNKTRFTLFILSLIVLIYLVVLLTSTVVRAQEFKLAKKHLEYQIKKGDTIWNIALKYKPDKYDVRKMVYDIKEYNQLDNYYLYPGDTIKVPLHEK